MRASLAVVVLAAALTAHADDLDGWQFRVISVTRAEPAQQGAATVISEPDKLAAAEPADSGFYVVMFSAQWCGPCQAYKRTTLPQLRDVAPVTETDMDKEPAYWRARVVRGSDGRNQTIPGVSSIPSFWLVRKSDRWPVARWTGPTAPATIAAEIQRQKRLQAERAAAPAPEG
jgi:thiol-disulfide isomerase/thioredoxin